MRGSLAVAISLSLSISAQARIIHVKSGADSEKVLLGETWGSATGLQHALTLAEPGDQLWLAAGRYSPVVGFDLIPLRCASYQLPAGVALFGGFEGGEGSLSERRLRAEHQTVLSGDFEGDDVVDPVTGVTLNPQSIVGQNASEILSIVGGSRSTIVDGVTLTGAKRSGTINRCNRNTALYIARGSPTIRNCRFIGNYGHQGGAILISESPQAVIVNCLFLSNEAYEVGGAIYATTSNPLILNCTFLNHEVDGDGSTVSFGVGSTGLVANSILWNNQGLGGRRGTILAQRGSAPLVVGCVVQGLRDSGWGDSRAEISVEGNIEADPGFVKGTYRLRMDSVARGLGNRLLLPTDVGDLDGDSDESELLPYDLAGFPYGPFSWFPTPFCDAGCVQYDPLNTDSDLDGYSDSFESKITGSAFALDPPRITQLVREDQSISLQFRFARDLREFTDFLPEGAATLKGPWRVVDWQQRISSQLNKIENLETWSLSDTAGLRFFRIRTVPSEE